MAVSLLSIEAEPLTAAAFEPFGTVIEHTGEGRRHYITEAFRGQAAASEPSMWISRVMTPTRMPLVIEWMERHPFSTQTFVPMGPAHFLIVVCLSGEDGLPDPASFRAFVSRPGQGVTYRRNVWHYGLSVFDTPTDFIVAMSLTGNKDDDVFFTLGQPVQACLRSDEHSE
ncbi:ureidoglycolate lyase [Parapusillimonas sp. JC17]|uniref:ureidoglycolate lyase n=1 Tax=Parapusillimonas sp. JC17 TaxID=3445768 RepID=UPI003FA102FE